VTDPFLSASGEPAVGTQIAGYRLDEQIGRGGMAVVYRARDVRLDRWVALKIMSPDAARDDAFRQRFIHESRAAAAVDHPHIIPIFEAGEASGLLFIAMRFVAGGDVRALVRRLGPLAAGRAGHIVTQVASALDAAHASGLVHRDVKPANMLIGAVTASGYADHVYLSDFGLSKQSLSTTGLTAAGQFLGTLDYIAPEQIEGRPVDGRADLYGLACAAFEMLSGSPPFRRDENLALIWAQLSEPPPPLTSRRADLPRPVDQVLARAMAKSPDDRYASCQEFAAALRAACGPGGRAAGPPPVRPRPATELAMPVARHPAATAQDRATDPRRPVRADPAWPRPGQPAGAPPGPAGPYPAGSDLARPVGPDLFRPRPDRAGPDRPRPDRAGPDRPRPDRAGADRPRPDRAGADRPRPDRAGADRAGADRLGPDRARLTRSAQPPGDRPRRRSRVLLAVAGVVIVAVAAGAFALLHGGNQGSGAASGSAGGSSARSARSTALAGPAATVRAYFTAISRHEYARAWRLGGRNATSSYPAFVQGFDGTAKDTAAVLSVAGDVVTARITALQTDGTVKTYQGTYTVRSGVIVTFNVRQTY
jgi:serine/threonine-protein kinase